MKILFCTDGSNYSQEGLRYAAWLARKTEGSVTALYVSDLRRFEMPAIMDVGGSLGIQPYQNLVSSLQEAEKEKAKYMREFTLDAFKREGVETGVEFVNQTGMLVDTIEESEEGYDLVVIGKRGESADFAIEHIGSTVERVVRASERPCFVTNRSFREIKRVAFAFDDGASCRKLMESLGSWEWLKEFPLHLLSVDEEGDGDSERLRAAEEQLVDSGFSVRSEMLAGVPEDAISGYVDESDIDLLLMGAYGHTRIRRFLIGSTTSEMLRRCRIPVLCYH